MQNFTCKVLTKYKWAFLLVALPTLFFSCEIEEEDLEDDWVQVIVPRDLLETDIQTVDFVWEALDGADDYQLQIAKPSFLDDEIEALLVDTVTTGTRFSYTFSPGKYEWRIRGRNSTSTTYYRKRLMKIDSATSLANQRIILRSPASNAYTNNKNPKFEWERLAIAQVHRFQIYEGSTFDGNLYTSELAFSNGETSTSLPVELVEGTYSWGVRGEETFSNTPYSTRVLNVDLTEPNKPTLSTPNQNSALNGGNVKFTWAVSTVNGGAPEFDTLEIYADTNLTQDSLINKYHTTNREVTVDTLIPGDYFWRVKRYDQAGNSGEYSTTRKVNIN